MSEMGDFSGLSIHQSFCMPAKSWEVQQEALECVTAWSWLVTALPAGLRGAQALGEQMNPPWLEGEHDALWQGVFYREHGRVIKAQK